MQRIHFTIYLLKVLFTFARILFFLVMNSVNSCELDAFKKKHTVHKRTIKAAIDKFRSV